MSWRLNHPGTCVSRWPLQNAVGVITPDAYGRYPGTLVNAPTWGVGPKNSLQCIELDGDDAHVNVGDVTQLNAVSAFTICFWMNQDVLDIADNVFLKNQDAADNINIITTGGGDMRFYVSTGGSAYGRFDYSTAISAFNWHNVAMVYDGTQSGNATRLLAYVDGAPITLIFTGTIQTATADTVGTDVTIGGAGASFNGRLWDFRLYNVPLSRDEISRVIHQPAPLV